MSRLVAAARGVLWWLVLAASLPAQASASYERLPAAGLRFGDAFEVLVRIELGREETCEALPAAAFLPLQVELLAASDASSTTAVVAQLWRYRAVATHAGPLPERQLAVPVRAADGQRRELSLQLPPLAIASVLPEPPGELEWDLPLRALPVARWPWLLALLGVLLGGGLLLRRRAEAPLAPPPLAPREPAAAVALRALAALPLPAAGDAAAADAFAVALVAVHAVGLADQRSHRHFVALGDVGVAGAAFEAGAGDVAAMGETNVGMQVVVGDGAIAAVGAVEGGDAAFGRFGRVDGVVAGGAELGSRHAWALAAGGSGVAEAAGQLVVDHVHAVRERRFGAARWLPGEAGGGNQPAHQGKLPGPARPAPARGGVQRLVSVVQNVHVRPRRKLWKVSSSSRLCS